MSKLTKAQLKAHTEAEKILTQDRLTDDEIEFVFANWHEGANHNISAAGAFFTPDALAGDAMLELSGNRIIDLCAGIGALAYNAHCRKYNDPDTELTCVEINPRYVAVGRKLVPQARWICADVLDYRDWWQSELNGQTFDCAIGNPPFGNIARRGTAPRYKGKEFEFHVIDIAGDMADAGVFIVPQQSANFQYSGSQYFKARTEGRAVEFCRLTGWTMRDNLGIDTAFHKDSWKAVSIITEIVTFDFAEDRLRKATSGLKRLNAPAFQNAHQAEQMLLL